MHWELELKKIVELLILFYLIGLKSFGEELF